MSTEKTNHGKSFFDRLISLQKTMNAAEFCRFIGVSTPLFHKWKNGSIPGRDKLRLISERLNVSSDWLLTGKGTELPINALPDPVPGPACHYPEGGELEAKLESLSHRMSVMEGQLDTVIRLLGPILRADSLDQDQPETKAG